MSTPGRVKKSLNFSFADGLFASAMTGLTADYITPYALALQATVRQIGFLSALPNLLSSLVQLGSAGLADRLKSRKKIIIIFVLLHLLMGIPIILIPYIFKAQPVLSLVIFVTLFTSLNAFAGPAWASLMSEYIPYKLRGKYFGWRNKIMAAVTIFSAFLAGFILQHSKNNILKGFTIIFGAAVIFRFISWCFLTRMYEPPYRPNPRAYFSFLDFIKRVRESNFAKFVIFAASLTFCVNLASPFFSVFMIRDLKFNYFTYTIVVTVVTVAQIITFDRWGRHADKVGNVKVLRLTSFIIASLPLWWIFNQSPLYLVFAQILSGFAWSGFNLCATNFIYDAVSPPKRVRCIAYFNVFSGIGVCLGALCGAFLVDILPALLGYKILSLFLLASVLRFAVVFIFSGRIKEVRKTEHISSKDLFYSVIGIKPMLGVTQDSRQIIRK